MDRAILDLCQLPDAQLFDEVAEGIEHLIEGIERLDSAARSLSTAKDEYPAKILGNLAEEEASKILILMDAIRCPRNRGTERSRLLGYFYSHLPKGIYVEVCSWGGVLSFGELQSHIDREREAHYLDGPNDVDWIFRNQIIQRREDDLYVNYVREDGRSNRRYWTSPSNQPMISLFPYSEHASMVIRIARALHEVGVTSTPGLAIVAEIWRPVQMTPGFRVDELRELNWTMLSTLEKRGLRRQATDDACRTVVQRWPFPLYDLELKERNVDVQRLREIQQNWTPD